MYGIYEAVFYASWKVEFRLDDSRYRSALDGDVVDQNAIIKKFKAKAEARYGKRIDSVVNWNDQYFDIKRVRDALPPKKAARIYTAEELGWDSDLPPCPCPDSCVQCDIGNHYQCRNCPRTR